MKFYGIAQNHSIFYRNGKETRLKSLLVRSLKQLLIILVSFFDNYLIVNIRENI